MMDKTKGHIVFVGDSIQIEYSAAFAYSLYRDALSKSPPALHRQCSLCYQGCLIEDAKPLPCPFANPSEGYDDHLKMHIVRDDLVCPCADPYWDTVGNFFGTPWFKDLGRVNASLLILNKGAHFIETADNLARLNDTLHHVTRTYPNISIVWRTTPPGHDTDAADIFFSEPLLNYTNVPRIYNWDRFYEQNEAVLAFLDRHYPEVLVLDLVPSTALRQDSHINGLHYCLPGPLDTWAILLYNALLIIDDATEAEVH
jgi:hypothetical protein